MTVRYTCLFYLTLYHYHLTLSSSSLSIIFIHSSQQPRIFLFFVNSFSHVKKNKKLPCLSFSHVNSFSFIHHFFFSLKTTRERTPSSLPWPPLYPTRCLHHLHPLSNLLWQLSLIEACNNHSFQLSLHNWISCLFSILFSLNPEHGTTITKTLQQQHTILKPNLLDSIHIIFWIRPRL